MRPAPFLSFDRIVAVACRILPQALRSLSLYVCGVRPRDAHHSSYEGTSSPTTYRK